MKKYLLNFLLLVLPFVAINAQKTLDEGFVRMEIMEVGSDDPQMAMGLEMLKGSTTEISFTKGQYVTVMNMMGGMVNMKNYVNTETQKMDMLFDAMGNKMWVDTNLEEAKKNKPQDQNMSDYKVTYDESTTKDILGYKAMKVNISVPNQEGMSVEGWVTKEIKSDANIIQGMEDLKLEGFPLAFTIKSPQMNMTFEATEIKEKVDASIFTFDSAGYKKMTMEEFSKSMGGMGGGMGF